MEMIYDVIILGAGPAGLAAGRYGEGGASHRGYQNHHLR